MRVAIHLPNVPRSRACVEHIRDILPADKLQDFQQRIIPAVLPVTFKLDNKGATITFDD